MDVNEAFRRIIVGHLAMIAGFVVAGLVVGLGLGLHQRGQWVASSRIQAAESANLGSSTQSAAILNQVQGIATSPAIVQQALTAAGLTGRSISQLATNEITVTPIGSSAVMDVTVTDRDARFARSLATALGKAVVGYIAGGAQRQSNALVATLTAESQKLLTQQQQLVAALDAATIAGDKANAVTVNLSAQLTSVDQQLTDLTATLRQLQVSIATSTTASVISPPGPAQQAPSNTATELALAGLGGLVLGLIVASVLEVVRPTVADGRAFARALGVPLLGRLTGPRRRGRLLRRRPAAEPDVLGVNEPALVRQAALAAGVHTLILACAGRRDALGEHALARRLTVQLERLAPAANGHRVVSTLLLPEHTTAAEWQARGSAVTAPPRRLTSSAVTAPTSTVRVVPMTHVGPSRLAAGHGLLVVAAPLARTHRLEQIRDLAAATALPVVGVLDDRARGRATDETGTAS